MKQETEKKIEFLFNHLWWIDKYYRKYGNPNVITNKSRDIGEFTTDNIAEAFRYIHFFEETPHLWDGKRVLDLGCGGSRIKETIASLYPSVDYVGLDIEPMEGVDVVADAEKKLPFDDAEFDTLCAFAYMPVGIFGTSGSIRHWRRHLKPDGNFVAACVQNFMNEKYDWYKTIRKSFRIVEEKCYDFSYKRDDFNFAMPMYQTFIIARQKGAH